MASQGPNKPQTSDAIAAFAPINRLPTEILIEIFRCYTTLDLSAWRLALVCKNWQQTVRGTSKLWTHITLASDDVQRKKWALPGDAGAHYSSGCTSVCSGIRELKEALARAGNLSLYINVTWNYYYAELVLVAMLTRLFHTAIASRIVTLHIQINIWLVFSPIQLPGPDSSFGFLSNLQQLIIDSCPPCWTGSFLKPILAASATSLRELQISQSSFSNGLVELIQGFLRLEKLHSGVEWPTSNMRKMILTRLTDLEVKCHPRCLGRLEAPHLTSLILFEDHCISGADDEYHYLEFPELTILQSTSRDTQWIESINAPRLQYLSITIEAPPSEVALCLLPPNLFPTVSQISYALSWSLLEGGDKSDNILTRALRAVPNALTVILSVKGVNGFTMTGTCTWLYQLETLGSVEEDNIICPKLQDLIIQSDMHSANRDDLLLRGIANARRKAGRGLSQLMFEYTYEEGMAMNHAWP